MKSGRKILALMLSLLVGFTVTGCGKQSIEENSKTELVAGTYESSTTGMGGEFKVSVTLDAQGTITEIAIGENLETPGVGKVAAEEIANAIIAEQNLEIDSITGATVTSSAIKLGVKSALKSAGANIKDYQKGKAEPNTDAIEKSADVIIVGGGGAGLAAAVAATDEGASVIVMEKTGILGGNTIVSGGIYNCVDEELQAEVEITDGIRQQIEAALNETPINEEHAELISIVQKQYDEYNANGSKGLFDSNEWFALMTWNAGDKVANLDLVKELAYNATEGLEWVKSMGLEFMPKIGQGGGSLYQRTHTSKEPLGTGFIGAYRRTLADRSDLAEVMLNCEAQELITDGNKVVEVKGVTKDGASVTLKANKSVILATGGFAGNIEMRNKYNTSGKWPELGENIPSSNMAGMTGDGIVLAEDAGANLVDMDQIQLIHLGNPYGAVSGIPFQNSAALYIYVNQDGYRFVREDGRRDEISLAMLEQEGGLAYLINNVDTIADPNTDVTKEGMTIAEEERIGWIFSGETLDELAEKINVPAENLKATLESFNKSVETQSDEFGRNLFTKKLEDGPWYALPRIPAVHHTMGGIHINTDCQVLSEDGSVIEGLYATGEVTGGIHGANRVGGNAVVDTVVFGRIAGTNAAK